MLDIVEIKKKYIPRITDVLIERGLKLSPTILITGSKWCGKSWSGCFHSKSFIELSDSSNDYSNKKLAIISPNKILQGETPRVIDEWQEVPELWDAVRSISDTSENGHFILTGSVFENKRDKIFHSGFGRILNIRMFPMTILESDNFKTFITFDDLFTNKEIVPAQVTEMTLDKLISCVIRGGWPKLHNMDWNDAKFILQGNLDNISNENKVINGRQKLNNEILISIFKSYARNISTYADISTLYNDTNEQLTKKISLPTFNNYLKILKDMYLIDEIKSWSPNFRSRIRIRGKSKIIFSDPSLACAVIDATPDMFLKDLNYFGFLFENLVMRDLKTFGSIKRFKVLQYRDSNGLECDAILEKDDGTWGCIEIKLGNDEVEKAIRTFEIFDNKVGSKSKIKPSFYAVITGVGGILEKRKNVFIIPFDTLGI